MKKRVCSLLLAVLTVFSAVPALFMQVGAEQEILFSSSYLSDMQENVSINAETNEVSYGDWYPAILAYSTYEPVKMTHRHPKATEPYLVTDIGFQKHTNYPTWGTFGWGSLDGNGVVHLNDYSFGFTNKQVIGTYVYEITEEGVFDIHPTVEQYEAPTGEFSYYFAVMVNEQMVWPVYGASYEYTSVKEGAWDNKEMPVHKGFEDTEGVWYHVTASTTKEALNAALAEASIVVETGDRLAFAYRYATPVSFSYNQFAKAYPAFTATAVTDRFLIARDENGKAMTNIRVSGDTVALPDYTGEGVFMGWDTNGDGKADAKAGGMLSLSSAEGPYVYIDAVAIGASRFMDHFPAYDANNERIAWDGGWQVGTFDASFVFQPYTIMDNYGILTGEAGAWSGDGGLYTKNPKGQFAFSGGCISAIQYTAPYNGVVMLDYDKLIGEREGSKKPDYIAYDFAIYKSGERIWPVEEEWYSFSTKEISNNGYDSASALDDVRTAGAFPICIEVEQGEEISFLSRQGNVNNWMMYAEPRVTYKELLATPSVAATGVTVGADLGLDIYVDILGGEGEMCVGLECWTTKPNEYMLQAGGKQLEGVLAENGMYKFTYGGLSAKQMADLLYVRPFIKTAESEIYGTVVSCSVQQYVERALGKDDLLDRVLIPMLCYGGSAQALFKYNTGNLAHGFIESGDRPPMFDSQYLVNVYDNAEGKYRILAASLLLEDTLGFKFVINAVEGATTYMLEVATDAAFTDAQQITMAAAWGGREYVGQYHVPYAKMDTVLYVRAVVDGEAGATLTYSFDSYYKRMELTDNNNLFYTLSALATFDRALRDYIHEGTAS